MKKIAFLLTIFLASQLGRAQNVDRVITTGVPFLLIAADARSAGMGDMGVATSADAFSHNITQQNMLFLYKSKVFR